MDDAPERVQLFRRIKKAMIERVKSTLKYIGYKWVLPIVYKWYARKPIDEKLVVFADDQFQEMTDNFLCMYKICEANGFHFEILISPPIYKNATSLWDKWKRRIGFKLRFIKMFARCRVLFLANYFSLAYVVKPRSETQIVQLWHACGAMKMFGYSTDGKKWGGTPENKRLYKIHSHYNLVAVSGPKAVPAYEDAFRCQPGVVQALGVPRTDIYFDKMFGKIVQDKIYKEFPQIGKRKVILYAPTFRGNSLSEAHMDKELNYSELNMALSDEYVLFVKFHPLMKGGGLSEVSRLQNLGFVFDVSKLLSPEEALLSADVLITDYSSIVFEYLLLERPVISYIYDIDDYVRDRGLYYPYEQLAPGPYVATPEELLEKLQTVSEWFDIEKTQRFKQEFMSACDGHSTERIYQHIFGQPPSVGGKV